MSFSAELKDFIGAYKEARTMRKGNVSDALAQRKLELQEKMDEARIAHYEAMDAKLAARGSGSGGSVSDYSEEASGAGGPPDDGEHAIPANPNGTPNGAPTQSDDGATGLQSSELAPTYLPDDMSRTAFGASGGLMGAPQIPPLPVVGAQSPAAPAGPAAGPEISPAAYKMAGADAKAAMRAAIKAAGRVPAMSPDEMEAVSKTVDPTGQMPPHLKSAIVLGQFYNHFQQKGQAEQGARAAAGLLLANKQAVQKLGGAALQAFASGDMRQAASLFNDAVNRFPSGHAINVQVDPRKGLTYTLHENGEQIQSAAAKPEQFGRVIQAVADGSAYDKEWLQSAKGEDVLAGDAGADTLSGGAAPAIPPKGGMTAAKRSKPPGARSGEAGTDLVLPKGVTRTEPYGGPAGWKWVGKGRNKHKETYGWQGGKPPLEGTFGHEGTPTGGSGSAVTDQVLPAGVRKTQASSDAPMGFFTLTNANGEEYEVP